MLLTTRHPFVRELIRFAQSADLFHPVAAVTLESASDRNEVSTGLLAVFEANLRFGVQRRRFLLPQFVRPDGEILAEAYSRRLLRIALDEGRTSAGAEAPDGERLRTLFREARAGAEAKLGGFAKRLREQEERRIRPRVAEVRNRYDRRLASADERLRSAIHAGDQTRADGIRTLSSEARTGTTTADRPN